MTGRKRDVSGPDGGLTHNPFAALRGGEPSPAAPSGAAESAAAPADEAVTARRVIVRIERRGHGGKTVTRVEAPGGDLDARARRWARSLGTQVRVDGEDLLLQGDLIERVVPLLEAEGSLEVVRGTGSPG